MDAARRNRIAPWLKYSALRLVFFVVPLAVVYAVGGNIVVAAVVAAIIGLCLSVVLLDRRRNEVTEVLATRTPRRPADEDVEDAALDGSGGQNASAAASPRP